MEWGDKVLREHLVTLSPICLPAALPQLRGARHRCARCLVAYCFNWAENQVAAAIKAVPIGQVAGQHMLRRMHDVYWLQSMKRYSAQRKHPRGFPHFHRCWACFRRDTKRNTPGCSVPESRSDHDPGSYQEESSAARRVGGPVGSGKTTLLEMLCKAMRDRYDLIAITNDIYTKEDQRLLTISGALPAERIMGVETGGCPHTAIREDASINLEAVDRMLAKFPDADVVFIESGGDNLAATFSPELSDLTIYVIDVAGGEKIPRKGGPGITKSDLLVINKTDLAPYVGASLEVMESDARKMRGERPFVMGSVKSGQGLDEVIRFIERQGMLGV